MPRPIRDTGYKPPVEAGILMAGGEMIGGHASGGEVLLGGGTIDIGHEFDGPYTTVSGGGYQGGSNSGHDID